MAKKNITIRIIGDLVAEWHVTPAPTGPKKDSEDGHRTPSSNVLCRESDRRDDILGGTHFRKSVFWKISDLYRTLRNRTGFRIHTYELRESPEYPKPWLYFENFPLAIWRLDKFPRDKRSPDPKKSVFRIKRLEGYSSGKDGQEFEPMCLHDYAPDDCRLAEYSRTNRGKKERRRARRWDTVSDYLLIADLDLGYRKSKSNGSEWNPLLNAIKRRNADFGDQPHPNIILTLDRSVPKLGDAGDLLTTLAEDHSEWTIAIVSGTTLRTANSKTEIREGASISRAISWERTVQDLRRELKKDGGSLLRKFRHLIVRFGANGAVYAHKNGTSGDFNFELLYEPTCVDGTFRERRVQGTVKGYNAILSSTILCQLELGRNRRTKTPESIKCGIRDGLKACQLSFWKGFGVKADELEGLDGGIDFNRYRNALRPKSSGERQGEEEERDTFQAPLIATASIPTEDGKLDNWNILTHQNGKKFPELAKAIVHHRGLDEAVNRTGPEAEFFMPVIPFNELLALSRSEIEQYSFARNLIKQHLESGVDKPLSIAIFGQPGSGKSFVSEQIARAAGQDNIKLLESNVAQWSSSKDLAAEMTNIAQTHAERKLPLAIFDEFDASLPEGGSLGWLKFFLGPMEDGVYRDAGMQRRELGKAIFVFSGGTSQTFDEFGRKVADKKNEACKGSDFMSRLGAYLNVPGINLKDEAYLIRRAVLVARFVKEMDERIGGGLEVAEDMLFTLIEEADLIHGARSLRAVVRMCVVDEKKKLDRAAFPPGSQLLLHVRNAERILEKLELPSSGMRRPSANLLLC